jgi:hypothetical protein
MSHRGQPRQVSRRKHRVMGTGRARQSHLNQGRFPDPGASVVVIPPSALQVRMPKFNSVTRFDKY